MKINNNENIFYILINNTKEGPWSLNDLKNFKPTGDTLIWYYGISDWKKISDVEEIKEELKLHIQPPKLNNENINNLDKNDIEVILKKEQTDTSIKQENNKKVGVFSKKETQNFVKWIAFHSIALLLSYGRVKGFNERGWYSSKVVWPFGSDWTWCNDGGGSLMFFSGTCESNGGVTTFNGIFTGYDIADYLLYVGISVFIMLFIYVSRKNK
jgi:hypothetical protein